MKKIKDKIFLAVVAGALIGALAVYFAVSNRAKEPGPSQSSLAQNQNQVQNQKPSQPAVAVVATTSIAQCLAPEQVLVTKVIDGDTLVVEGGFHVRILSIDADERGYPCYEAASKRLEELVLNKKARLEKDISDVDQYKRCLRYVFLGQQDIGLELVKEGLAIARFYPPDIKYQAQIIVAEKAAITNKTGCKWANRP